MASKKTRRKSTITTVSLKESDSYFQNCQDHSGSKLYFFCRPCEIAVCHKCTNEAHLNHDIENVMENCMRIRERISGDTKCLEEVIQPEYRKVETQIQTNVLKLTSGYEQARKAVVLNGEIWHKAVDDAVKKCLDKIDIMEKEDFANLREQRKMIANLIAQIQTLIDKNRKLLEDNDIPEISMYKSKNEEYLNIPTVTSIIAPVFKYNETENVQIPERFGALKASMMKKSREYVINISTVTPKEKQTVLDNPLVIRKVSTKFDKCWSVQCVKDQQAWISGDVETVAKVDIQGNMLEKVSTRSKQAPFDLSMTSKGDLVYTDYGEKTVNIMKKGRFEPYIKLQGWNPLGICSTESGEILLCMDNRNDVPKQRGQKVKVVRYVNNSPTQEIQYDDGGFPLYMPGDFDVYIAVNTNQDVCVSDRNAKAVVTTDNAGRFRWRYYGNIPSRLCPYFDPRSIATDSNGRILVSDADSNFIHLLDDGGHFLKLIGKGFLEKPVGISLNSDGNLFVVEYHTAKLKVIKYLR
ncbi:uncharacterized protein LOC133187736 [Saccostrea echinata]|uniref:uncharacterized protein LOC133187736 n=1 Tax=Saccostrea echinata TaxID=191078 RepID=UPI002A820B13|nr:uncharacterized protein LOC133187736 [Saccostrea echinata]